MQCEAVDTSELPSACSEFTNVTPPKVNFRHSAAFPSRDATLDTSGQCHSIDTKDTRTLEGSFPMKLSLELELERLGLAARGLQLEPGLRRAWQ